MNEFECPFSLHARKSGKSIALVSDSNSWTYRECHNIIEGIAHTLKEKGIKEGSRIALPDTNVTFSPLLFFALFRIRAIVCPLNNYLPKESIPQSLHQLNSYCTLPPHLECSPIKASQTFLCKKTHATYLFTSGTTTRPKIACHSLGNHYYSALGSNAQMEIKPGDHYLLSLPLYHIAGIAILFRTFLAGATLLLSDKIEDPRATHLSLIPTQLSRLLNKPLQGPNRCILLGGANISHRLYNKAVQKGCIVYPTYGMTEMSSQIATHFKPRAFSLGHPLPYREMKIAKDGEIYVRGKTLFQGYFDRDKGLSLPLNAEGWFCTRDLGHYSPKTGLQLLGRKDRLFISGGENIQPEEIEHILENIEGIEKAEVHPVPDEEFGFRPVAYIKSKHGFNEERIKAFLATILPRFKIPDQFVEYEKDNYD